jgi:hypothetical protein
MRSAPIARRLQRFVLIAVACSAASTVIARDDQPRTTHVVTIEHHGSRFTGLLRVPSTPARPPAVLLVKDGETRSLADNVAADHVASLELDRQEMEPDVLAQWDFFLRNDGRFPLVSVFAQGPQLAPAVIAARAARADGILTRGNTAPAAAELARVVARFKRIDAREDEDLAVNVASAADPFQRSGAEAHLRPGPSPGEAYVTP